MNKRLRFFNGMFDYEHNARSKKINLSMRSRLKGGKTAGQAEDYQLRSKITVNGQ
ncbi:hypothetical protein LBYZC6_43550 [Lacrimispora brassicae]